MKKIFVFLVICLLCSVSALADSPLTSTPFYKAYLDVPAVREAQRNPGEMTDNIKAFLIDDNNPLDQRIAVINAIGWDYEGLPTFSDYLDYYLEKNYGGKVASLSLQEICEDASPEQLVIFAYLRAMSDYFDVDEAFQIAQMAMRDPVEKQSFLLPIGLIASQIYLDMGEWCSVYQIVNDMLNVDVEKDLRPEAVDIVMDYIGLYEDECN